LSLITFETASELTDYRRRFHFGQTALYLNCIQLLLNICFVLAEEDATYLLARANFPQHLQLRLACRGVWSTK
jgi:hypothetical protein